MIVVDTSAMVAALVGDDVDAALLDSLAGPVHAPHQLDVDVISVLTGLVRGGKLSAAQAAAARDNLFALELVRHELGPLAERVWELSHQFAANDAAYLALAEALRAPLHTCDAMLATPGHAAVVVVHS